MAAFPAKTSVNSLETGNRRPRSAGKSENTTVPSSAQTLIRSILPAETSRSRSASSWAPLALVGFAITSFVTEGSM